MVLLDGQIELLNENRRRSNHGLQIVYMISSDAGLLTERRNDGFRLWAQ